MTFQVQTLAGPLRRMDAAQVARARCVLSDLDGCLISGDVAYPEAADFVRACGERLWIVSNNSTETAALLSDRLARMGLAVPPGRIVLAGEQAVRQLARAGRPVEVWATAPIRDLARDLGVLASSGADTLLLCRDPDLRLGRLAELARALRGGAALWVANTDVSHPGPDGAPVPETGAVLAALQAMLPGLVHRPLGKPDPALVELALSRAGCTAGAAVFIGDNPATDGIAAAAAGVPFLHLDRRPDQ